MLCFHTRYSFAGLARLFVDKPTFYPLIAHVYLAMNVPR